MAPKQAKLIKAVLGEEAYQALRKAIQKLNSKTVVDITEAHDALQMAPKSVVAFLMKEVRDMKVGEPKEIKLPFDEGAMILVNKLEADQYKGHIVRDGKIVHEFSQCSIPQLSAHLLSTFELYDESPLSADSEEASKIEQPKEQSKVKSDLPKDLQAQIDELNKKIDQLFLLAANSKPQVIVQTAPQQELKKSHKSKEKKTWTRTSARKQSLVSKDAVVEWDKASKDKASKDKASKDKGLPETVKKVLKKAGQMPKMPSPPGAGTKVGGSQGITRAGIHGDKTAHSDLNKKPVTSVKNPYLKVSKSEMNGSCSDCGHAVSHCLCFKALSKPKVSKSEDGSYQIHFESDWDKATILAFYQSLKKARGHE
jgi:DNA polymerase III gamma/tau subunit